MREDHDNSPRGVFNINNIGGDISRMSFVRLKEKEIKSLFQSIKEELKLIKIEINEIKNKNIPENVKVRIKKLEVRTLGIEEQMVSLEDRMRIIETSFQNLEATIGQSNDGFDAKLTAIDEQIIEAKAQFNSSLQELDDRKEDKIIIEEVEI